MTRQDISENQANLIYIGIGSNLGNRVNNIEIAKFLIISYGIKIIQCSSYYETLSWPNKSNPKFINVVISIKSRLEPKSLLQIFQKIEKNIGRKKSKKNAPRECDIDIIDYKSSNFDGKLTIPHKLMHKRNFVLIPLHELDKNWIHPKSKMSIKKLIFSLKKKEITSIKKI